MLERYEYDVYGTCHVLEPNFADDPDGQSDYGNPYLFTGRRVDILDNGSLKIQYNRNRYYDQHTGRWLAHDPLGITPNPQKPNYFNAISQYKDGLSLYEYVGSKPVVDFDSLGLSEYSWVPIYGTLCDIVSTPCGSAVSDYSSCQPTCWSFDRTCNVSIAMACENCVDRLYMSNLLSLMGPTVVADMLDVIGAVVSLYPGATYCAVGLVVDGVVHTIVNVQQLRTMHTAKEYAKIEYCMIPYFPQLR